MRKTVIIIFTIVTTFSLCSAKDIGDKDRDTPIPYVDGKPMGRDIVKIPNSFNLKELTGSDIYELTKQRLVPDSNGVLANILFELPDYKRAIYYRPFSRTLASGNRMEPLYFEDISDLVKFKGQKPQKPREDGNVSLGAFLMFEKSDGTYLAILPIVSHYVGNTLKVEDDGIYLECATYGTKDVNYQIPLFAYAESDNPYEAVREVWTKAKVAPNVMGSVNWRSEKEYPESFNYLGWCSWEHFKTNINENIINNAISDIKSSTLPIRWILIDDGYLDQEKGSLLSFGVDRDKFPNGWQPITSQKDDKIRWMGIWRNFNGYMQGISQNHTMTNLNSDIVKVGDSKPRYMSKTTAESADALYSAMTSDTKESGFDIIKVDFQSNNFLYNRGTENPILGVHYNNRALEQNCVEKQLHLLNCIAMQNFNVFNQSHSCVIRGSVDYKIDYDRIDLTIVQNFTNAFWLGHIHWIDQDMFHTSFKETARLMALSRAISGGPIYLSDETKNIDDTYLKPLMYEDGRIVGTLAPGVPLKESLFIDPYFGHKAFSVVAPLKNRSAAIMAVNLNRGESVQATISSDDYIYAGEMIQPYSEKWSIPSEGIILFDSYANSAQLFDKDYKFELKTREERLIQLSPIVNGWSVIGRSDKFMAASTFDIVSSSEDKIKIELVEQGSILIWCGDKRPKSDSFTFHNLGNGLWRGDLKEVSKSSIFEIRRE